jgi:hypothetical protein
MSCTTTTTTSRGRECVVNPDRGADAQRARRKRPVDPSGRAVGCRHSARHDEDDGSEVAPADRRARAAGQLAGSSPKRRGPTPQARKAERKRLEQLEREIERLRRRLKQAETIIEFQEELHELLGTTPESPPRDDENSR